jgi:hypothetical protein
LLEFGVRNEEFTLTREQLYESVWATPPSKLAMTIGISDVAIGKICRKLNVPKPYRGYWAKIEAGHKVRKTPLPEGSSSRPETITIRVSRSAQKPKSLLRPGGAVATAIQAIQENTTLTIPSDLRTAHPIVHRTNQLLQKQKADAGYGFVQSSSNDQCIHVRVSKALVRRAMLIMQALIDLFEKSGWRVEADEKTWACIKTESGAIRFKLEETLKAEKEKSSLGWDRTVYKPTGELAFKIDEYFAKGTRKNWRDKPGKPLEKQLLEIPAAILITLEAVKIEKDRRAEERRIQEERWQRHQDEQRKIAEKARSIKEELERRRVLEEKSDEWFKSQRLEQFLDACEKSLNSPQLELLKDRRIEKWFQWAREHAGRINPLKTGFLSEAIVSLPEVIPDCNVRSETPAMDQSGI